MTHSDKVNTLITQLTEAVARTSWVSLNREGEFDTTMGGAMLRLKPEGKQTVLALFIDGRSADEFFSSEYPHLSALYTAVRRKVSKVDGLLDRLLADLKAS